MENIMLMDSRKKHIKIIDFGLSNWHSDKFPQTHCGSPEYAAPELFYDGRKYGPEIDLWSLGVILYGMMAGQLPFLSPRNSKVSEMEWREKLTVQISRGFTTLQEKKISGASSDCQDLVRRLLQLQPNRRIPIYQIYHHPWIKCTINGRSSERALGHTERKTIFEEIHNATKMDSLTVEKEIDVTLYGEIAGMFNIIAHRIRGNGSVDVFGQSSKLSRRRPEIGRSFLREQSLPSPTVPKSSLTRPALMIDKSRSIRKIETSYKNAVEWSAELKKLSLSGNPLKSTCAIRNLDPADEWPWHNKEHKPNRLQIVGTRAVKSANGKAVSVKPISQPLRSILERRLTSSTSRASKDPRWRLSDPGILLTSSLNLHKSYKTY